MATLHQRPTYSHNQNQNQTQNQAQGNLCNFCHKWPKNPGHNFCSKTCASRGTQGATGLNNPSNGTGNMNNNNNNGNSYPNPNPRSNPTPMTATTTTTTNNPNAHGIGHANNAGTNGVPNGSNGNANRGHNSGNTNANNNNTNGNLCNFCRKKPKLPPHGFCGKTCATNAGAGAAPPPYQATATAMGTGMGQTTQAQTQTQTRGRGQGQGQGQGQGPRNNFNHRNGNNAGSTAGAGGAGAGATAPIDPVEIAKMVVDQIPYLKTFLPQNSPLLNGALMNPTTANLNLQGANGGVVVPGIPGTGTGTTAAGAGTATVHVVQVGDDDTDSEDEECALAGCTNSRYVDANGVESSYCSQRHRQQAVASGTIDPCIFCGVNPQSDGDYFCSRECREEALDKAKAGGHGENGGGVGDDEVQGLGKGGNLKQ